MKTIIKIAWAAWFICIFLFVTGLWLIPLMIIYPSYGNPCVPTTYFEQDRGEFCR